MTALPSRSVSQWARLISQAHCERWLLEPLTDTVTLTLDDAYAIQREVLAARLACGERRVGWKLGYTSAVMRAQMHVEHPNFGPLTDRMLLSDGVPVPPTVIQPRVEPEIAVILDRPLRPDARHAEALAAIREARCALEIVDSVWTDYRFRLEDNTADGSSAAYVVLGPALTPRSRLDHVSVVLTVDGRDIAAGQGSAAMGHPADALAWLATELAHRGEALAAGDLVITGGLTAAAALAAGSTVQAVFSGQQRVRTLRLSAGAR